LCPESHAANIAAPITIDFRNNIIWPSRTSGRYAGGETGFRGKGFRIKGSKNLWFGGKDPGTAGFATQSIFADPKFVEANGSQPDFHLQPASPALHSDDIHALSIVTTNYDANPTSNGATAINRGAY
jgi:hypothetical protein